MAHKYWRLRSTKLEPSGNQFGFWEFMFYDSSDNPLCVGGTPIASSTFGSASPADAFDGNNTTTYWLNNSSLGLPAWLGYNHASPVEPSYLIVNIYRPNQFAGHPVPGSTWIEYSDDGTTWTVAGRIYTTDGDFSNSGSGTTTIKWFLSDDPSIKKTIVGQTVSRVSGSILNQNDHRYTSIRGPQFRFSPYKGYGVISGVVTINDVPGSRKVRLFLKTSGQLVDEVWSEPDGDYIFNNVVPGVEYFVVGHDYTRSYNAVVQDMVVPT